jgi:hypothetical protein
MMGDSTRIIRGPRRAWPPKSRTGAAVIATACLAVLAAACGGSGSSAGSGGSPNAGRSPNAQSEVAYSVCMRSHRVPNFADPTTDSPGPVFNITKVGISDAALHTHHFLAVLNECGRLVGNNHPPMSFE